MKHFIHVDLHAFKTSVEQLGDSPLRGKPVLVGRRLPTRLVKTNGLADRSGPAVLPPKA